MRTVMSNTAKAFVAVDLGASGGKITLGVFDGRAFSLEDVHRFDNAGVSVWAHGPDGGATEQIFWDDLHLHAEIVEGLRRAGARARCPIVSVGIDTWGADAGLLNARGELLGRVYCYRDHRLDDVREQLYETMGPRELFDRSGIPAQPWYLINQLFWLRRHRPQIADQVAAVAPMASLLSYYLCGDRRAEATFMAVQQLCKVGSSEYDPQLVAATGMDASVLPEIAPPGATLGTLRPELAERTGLGPIPIVAVKSHDTASAYTAAPVTDRDRSLIISSGTWSLVGKLLDEPLVNDFVYENRLANEGLRGDIRLLRNVMGTWPVQQLRDAWSKADGRDISWPEITATTEAAPALRTLVDVDDPALFSPAEMEQAIREQIKRTGQSQPPDRAGLLRAVFEGLALAVAGVNELLAEATGQTHEVIHVVGGGGRNALLNQFIADATGAAVLAGPYEATCIGNILVQAVAGGAFENLAQAQSAVSASMQLARFEPGDKAPWNAAAEKLAKIVASRAD
jgi:rhamnulokinase